MTPAFKLASSILVRLSKNTTSYHRCLPGCLVDGTNYWRADAGDRDKRLPKLLPFNSSSSERTNLNKEASSMRYRIAAFLAACIALSGMSIAYASDVTGKWIAQVPGRDGQTREVTITLKAEGEKLTGSLSGRQGDTPISDGKIKGDELSFTVTINRQGNEVKQLYKGKVAGDEIKFTRSREGGDRPPVEFTAKRAK
jgi:hypothetical protein